MKALLAFSGGGGSGFPGAPVAGVYLAATAPEFLTICAQVVAVSYSIVTDISSGGLAWYSDGTDMVLLGGSVIDSNFYPTPGTVGGVTFAINSQVAIYDQNFGGFFYFDGVNWVELA